LSLLAKKLRFAATGGKDGLFVPERGFVGGKAGDAVASGGPIAIMHRRSLVSLAESTAALSANSFFRKGNRPFIVARSKMPPSRS
jgi:hypothetical protein